jgi:transcriptional regulator GlxA family with amidase domain
MSLSLQIVSIILQSWHRSGAPARPAAIVAALEQNSRFDSVISFMMQNLERKIARDELARLAHLHPGYFDRVFRAQYGVAPMQMLRDLRLRRAQELLESTSGTLESIARACGLGDAAQFSRSFRAHLGQTPGQFRKSAKMTRETYL